MEYPWPVADDARSPVAIRITRPYSSEDEFLACELETLTRTSIVLLGAQPRPQGVILRFELALATGTPLVRGEGRVVGYKERAFEDTPGLALRFTRLDSRSKSLIDRAAAMRDARNRPLDSSDASDPDAARQSVAGSPQPVSSRTRVDISDLTPSSVASVRPEAPPIQPEPPRPLAPPPASALAPRRVDTSLEETHAEAPRAKGRSEHPSIADRDDLLSRLRARARRLDDTTIQTILGRDKRG